MKTQRNPRIMAIDALEAIFGADKKPKQALDAVNGGLEGRDRAFLMELVYGVLRYRDYLDWILSGLLKRPEGLSSSTMHNLRLALYQIIFMRVPQWAVVHEAVSIEKQTGDKHALVNAVLRNYLRTNPSPPDPLKDGSEKSLAIATSHPWWLVKRWIKRFGFDETRALCYANNEIPHMSLRISNPEQRDLAIRQLALRDIVACPSDILPAAVTLEGTIRFSDLVDALAIPYVIQDEAAQLVGYLMNPSPGERVLDACAAPGGKTTHLAECMGDQGEVIALDRDAERLQLLQETVMRLNLKSIRAQCGNALDYHDNRPFDHILIDAPCSALGTVRRNPDIKYRLTQTDLDRLQITQVRMLTKLAKMVRPGGTIVYSVCSTEPDEGEMAVRLFLQEHQNFSIIEGDFPFFAPFACYDEKGFIGYRTFPHRHGMDGFYAVRMRYTL